MKNLIKLDDVNQKIITIRNQNVILDSDVAELYGVETMRINEAVKNNPDKFPEGYVFEINNQELKHLLSKFSIANISSKTRFLPKVFTERGLYMLATILKSPQAAQTTLAIVETFTKIRKLSREVVELAKDHENEHKQQSIMQKSSEILADIIGSDLEATDSETSFELNLFAAVKLKHTVKRSKKK